MRAAILTSLGDVTASRGEDGSRDEALSCPVRRLLEIDVATKEIQATNGREKYPADVVL